MSTFRIITPRQRAMLTLNRPRNLGGGYSEIGGQRQEDVTEFQLDNFFDKKDEGATKGGYPIIPRLGSVQSYGKCICGGDLITLQEPDNIGCSLCGRRQLAVYDPKEQNHMDDMSRMTVGKEGVWNTPDQPGLPGSTQYPRQNGNDINS